MVNVTDKMIALFVGGILAAALIPVGLQQLSTGAVGLTNISGTGVNVDASVIALYGIISIAVIVAVVILFFKAI